MKRLLKGEVYRPTGYGIPAHVRYWDVSPRQSPIDTFLFGENYFWTMS
ncbi:MAG: hypothetical protein LBJ00_16665 [Planctomycetaceae bacterium]|nr:hypothetical protein [Planctomycetaceae bacterium]